MKYLITFSFLIISSFCLGQVTEALSNSIDSSAQSPGQNPSEPKETIGIIRVNTDGAKLTKSENKDSQVLALLNKGQSLELLEIVFPDGLKSTSRYFARVNTIEGFITSYFVEPMILIGGQQTSLKQLESSEISKKEVVQLKVRDSLLQVKINQDREYFERLKVNEEEEIRKNDSIADIVNRKAKEEGKAYFESLRKKAQEDINKRRPVYVKKYGPVNGEKVAKGLIWIGMTEQMLIDSWGRPDDINTTVTRYGSRKQYVYGLGQYVYVVDGIVDSWQN
ncbi:MAG: hypothetical protein FJX80_07320 [Bacteroidetes bacterium]|nr:hypothetical protein [Bacteroidota bacterium]